VPERNIVKLIQPASAEDQLTGVESASAAARSVCRFREEKSLLFAATKTKWKILDEAVI
jgi:hypothetical protein